MRVPYVFFILLLPLVSLAQDIIVLSNGDLIKSKVIEIGQSEIKYKKISNPNGPIYLINKSEILSITFENGETEKFGTTAKINQPDANPKEDNIITLTPDSINRELINQYNSQYPTRQGKKAKSGIVTDGIIYWGFSDESILSSDVFEVRFQRRGGTLKKLYDWYERYDNDIIISIYNKTKSVLYIDLANTFKVIHYNGNDEGSTWYDSSVIGTNNSSGGGATLGLGAVASALGVGGTIGTLANGIGIGGGKTSSVSITTQMDRILSIPPMSEVELPPHKKVDGKKIISYYENFSIQGLELKKKLSIRKFELRTFTYDETLFKRDYYITFSKSPSFDSYSIIPIHLYVRAIYGYPAAEDVKIKDFDIENPDKMLLEHIYMWE